MNFLEWQRKTRAKSKYVDRSYSIWTRRENGETFTSIAKSLGLSVSFVSGVHKQVCIDYRRYKYSLAYGDK